MFSAGVSVWCIPMNWILKQLRLLRIYIVLSVWCFLRGCFLCAVLSACSCYIITNYMVCVVYGFVESGQQCKVLEDFLFAFDFNHTLDVG